MITLLGKHTAVPSLIYTKTEKGRSWGRDLEGAGKRGKSSVKSVNWNIHGGNPMCKKRWPLSSFLFLK